MGQNQPLELSEEERNGKVMRSRPNYDSRNQMAFDVLAEFGVAASHAITDIMGEKQAEALVRTEMQNGSLASTLNIKNRMGLEGQGLIFAAFASNWFNIIWKDLKVEITSIGFRWINKSCPLSRATSALCCQHDIIPKVITDIFAPGAITSNPKRISKGDDTCLILFMMEGVTPNQLMSAACICESLPPPLDLEEMALWNHSYLGAFWAILMKSMVNEIGSEMPMNALRPKFNEIGEEFADKFKEEYQVSIDNLDSVSNGLFSFHSSFLKKGKLERNSDGFTIITQECPYSGEPSEMCQLFQCFYDGLLEAINPEFVMKCSTMMSKGDKTCHWTIRKKGEVAKEKTKEVAALDDPIKRLTNKFIDGEITEEEFDKKMAHLRKHGLVK
jgi:hypothetical protein